MSKLTVKLLSFIFVFMFVLTGQVFAADLSIKIETPKTPSRENNLKIGFVALDIQGRPVTVKCLKKGPSEAAFSQFGSDIVAGAGGNSGDCQVSSSILSSQGTYEFKVNAQAGVETAESPVVSVTYATDSPGTPSYSREQLSSCDYKIKFKTADDGRTSKVKIYRSTETSFTADSGTEVGTVSIGPNLEGSFTNSVPDCGKNYYFAIRAFDDAGNGSGIAGDSVVTVVTKTTTTVSPSPTTALAGAIPVSISQVGAGEIFGEATEGTGVQRGILGEATPTAEISPAPAAAAEPFGNLFSLKNIIIGLVLIFVVYFLYRRFVK